MASKKDIERWCIETFGTTPVEILMRVAVNSSNEPKQQIAAAAAAAPYVHPRLRQVELIDNTAPSREQLEHDVHSVLEKYIGRGPGVPVPRGDGPALSDDVQRGPRDLIG